MSTLKSSAEHLTLNADGSGNDIKFQSNATEVAAIDQSGNLTLSGTVDGVDIQTLNTTAGAALPKAGGTMTGATLHGDNIKSTFGAGNDLEIYHQGGYSYIHDNGTGPLYIRATDLILKSGTDNDDYAKFIENGAAELYYSNAKKFETTATGATVTGAVSADSFTGAGSAKHVGIFSPSGHNTVSTAGTEDMDLSRHNNLVTGYTSYLTQSSNVLTIVKPGLYQLSAKALLNSASGGSEFNMYTVVTGYPEQRIRYQPANNNWGSVKDSGTYQLSAGNTINIRLYNSSPNGGYFYHEGPYWTNLSVTYLGT